MPSNEAAAGVADARDELTLDERVDVFVALLEGDERRIGRPGRQQLAQHHRVGCVLSFGSVHGDVDHATFAVHYERFHGE